MLGGQKVATGENPSELNLSIAENSRINVQQQLSLTVERPESEGRERAQTASQINIVPRQ
jgi:hypothetical protein